jgi:hypothetical protein
MLLSKVRERDLVGNIVPEEMTIAQSRLWKLSEKTVGEGLDREGRGGLADWTSWDTSR